jgi:Flp pilus assembly protein TadG
MELVGKVKKFAHDESGSISIVVIGLFLVLISTLTVITNIAAVGVAKRSLTQATEAAAQRGVRNLDKRAYYQGEFDATTQVRNLFRAGPEDPGIPIDCSKALGDSQSALEDWSNGPSTLRRVEITNLRISSINCDGFGIQLVTTAQARLPLLLPFINIDSVAISSSVSTTSQRAKDFSPFGIRIF